MPYKPSPLTAERKRRYVEDYVYTAFMVAVMVIWVTALAFGAVAVWRWLFV